MMKHMIALLFTLTLLFVSCSQDDKDHAEARYECTHYADYYLGLGQKRWTTGDPFFEIRRGEKQLAMGYSLKSKGTTYTIQREEVSDDGKTWKFKATDGMTTFDFVFQVHDTRYELARIGPPEPFGGGSWHSPVTAMSSPRTK